MTEGAERNWRMPDEVGFRIVEHTAIEMDDGVRLSARLWIPDVQFRVRESLRAFVDGACIFERATDELIPRQLL